jgi:hypothetical protein
MMAEGYRNTLCGPREIAVEYGKARLFALWQLGRQSNMVDQTPDAVCDVHADI